MRVDFNGNGELTAAMKFANGWSILTIILHCGHNRVIVVPSWFLDLDDETRATVIRTDKLYTQRRMKDARNLYEHIDDDNELVKIINEVASRGDAPVYGLVNHMMERVLRNRK